MEYDEASPEERIEELERVKSECYRRIEALESVVKKWKKEHDYWKMVAFERNERVIELEKKQDDLKREFNNLHTKEFYDYLKEKGIELVEGA
jgi:hypothetical protein